MTGGTRALTFAAIVRIIDAEGIGPIRDVGLLDSALKRPHTTVMGSDAYPAVPEKAAALLHSVCLNHALIDGNKRLAAIAALVFADINGYRTDLNNDQLFDLIMDVASGEERDVPNIAQRLMLTPR